MYVDQELSLMEHLLELRSRLIKASLALVVGTAISWVLVEPVLQLIIRPLGDSVPQAISPTETILVYFRVMLILGVTIAMPVIVYQFIRFLLPALLPHEKKYLNFLIPGATICFVSGVAFATLVMLPGMIMFMQSFLISIVENRWTISNYINFVTFVMFWMGILFQMPLIIFFLAKLNVVTAKQLSGARRWAIMVSAVVAAIVTPTHDPINMVILMIPLIVLYEIGVFLARFAHTPEQEEAEAFGA
jgi:sec-independent protein translocase protein TatC